MEGEIPLKQTPRAAPGVVLISPHGGVLGTAHITHRERVQRPGRGPGWAGLHLTGTAVGSEQSHAGGWEQAQVPGSTHGAAPCTRGLLATSPPGHGAQDHLHPAAALAPRLTREVT